MSAAARTSSPKISPTLQTPWLRSHLARIPDTVSPAHLTQAFVSEFRVPRPAKFETQISSVFIAVQAGLNTMRKYVQVRAAVVAASAVTPFADRTKPRLDFPNLQRSRSDYAPRQSQQYVVCSESDGTR
jgi:hypothetical protein